VNNPLPQPAPSPSPGPAVPNPEKPAPQPDQKAAPDPQPDAQPNPTPQAEPPAEPSTSRADGAGNDEVHQALGAGNASATHQLRSQAASNLNVGHQFPGGVSAPGANFVAGDMYVQTLVREIRPGELPRHIVDAVTEAFVVTAGYTAMTALVKTKPALIMRAAEGRGRKTAAIRVLMDRQVQKVLVLPRDTDLSKLADALEQDVGYLLCDPAETGSVSAHTLNDLTSKLEQVGAHLVVTVALGTGMGDEDVLDSIVELTEWPSHEEVVHSHLRWRLDGRYAAVAALPELKELIDGLDPDGPLRQAADLARVIAVETNDAGEVDIGRVQTYQAQRGAEDFEIWFDSLPDLEHRCCAIAMAVLNGLPYEYVMAAAKSLYGRLTPPVPVVITGSAGSTQVPLPPHRDPFQHSRRNLLRVLRGRVEEGSLRGEHGLARVETLHYRDTGYAGRIIRRTWSEFALQDVLLDWLADLVAHQAEPVRVWSATALGIVCGQSFEHVAQTVLQRWATSKRPVQREAVAHALHVPAADLALRPLVTQMARGWFADHDKPLAQATSARAYGYSLGRTDPDAALAILHRLASVDDLRISISIGASLAELLIDNDATLAEPILATIIQWLQDHEREGTAHLAFLVLSAGVLSDVTAADAASVSWPTLLLLAHERPNLRWGLASIWHHLLANSPYFAEEAENVLREWAHLVDADPLGCSALASLAHSICENNAWVRGHLLLECQSWTDPDEFVTAPHAAAAVHAALASER
jgi:hypothetical protein